MTLDDQLLVEDYLHMARECRGCARRSDRRGQLAHADAWRKMAARFEARASRRLGTSVTTPDELPPDRRAPALHLIPGGQSGPGPGETMEAS